MRIVVEYDLCESNGLCEEAAPELFRLGDDDNLYVLNENPAEELRAKAKSQLGAKYDDRGFHDTILLAGSMPLGMLETRVDEWIAKVKAS